MLKLFRKVFWVPCEDSSVYPDLIKTMDAISQYCEKNGDTCTFTADDEVEINGKSMKFPENMNLEAVEITGLSAWKKSRKKGRRMASFFSFYLTFALHILIHCIHWGRKTKSTRYWHSLTGNEGRHITCKEQNCICNIFRLTWTIQRNIL